MFREASLVSISKVVQIPGSGVDLSYYRPVPIVMEPVTFLLISRLLANKGVREYAAAAQQIRRRWPEVRCLLAGPAETGGGSVPLDEVRSWERMGAIDYLGPLDDVRSHLPVQCVRLAILPGGHATDGTRGYGHGATGHHDQRAWLQTDS